MIVTVNSKKEIDGSVKLGQDSSRLLWLKSAVETIESNWAKRSQFGPGSSKAWRILASQVGPRNQYGSEQI